MHEPALNRCLDAAILRPELTSREVAEAIRAQLAFKVRTVCVRPLDIPLAADLCRGTETAVCCVLAFPHGTALPASKADEANRYTRMGVAEIDMVGSIPAMLAGDWRAVEEDILAVSTVTRPAGVTLKVILETGLLPPSSIAPAVEAAVRARADFVKTATGFNGPGATPEAVKEMVRAAAGRIAVKAAGGIRDSVTAMMYIRLGCGRIGANYTSTAAICGGAVHGPSNGY